MSGYAVVSRGHRRYFINAVVNFGCNFFMDLVGQHTTSSVYWVTLTMAALRLESAGCATVFSASQTAISRAYSDQWAIPQ